MISTSANPRTLFPRSRPFRETNVPSDAGIFEEGQSSIIARELTSPKMFSGVQSLNAIFAKNRGPLLLTYFLLNVENLLRLAQPLVLGLAINDLLHESAFGLLVFAGQHLTHLLLSSLRQMYDTRVFTRIYTNLATQLVVEQSGRDVGLSRVVARSSLSREFVEFFENQVPLLIRSGYSILGALVMLAFYDWHLVPICLGLLLPAVVLNRIYARRTLDLSRQLHDELEHEVDVIDRHQELAVRCHYDSVASWRIKLSDCEAFNFATMELFVLGVMLLALLRSCSMPSATPGDIFAIFRYVLMLLMGVDAVPKLVQHVSRLRDLTRRFRQ